MHGAFCAPATMPTFDDDSTVIRHPASGQHGSALPAGTRIGEFEIEDTVGAGGFGIVYRAQDHSLGRRVAIKEYMPAALAERTQSLTVSIRSQRDAETFAAGLRSFINEARLLAQFDHPSLLKVYRFWEANGTAYMVMPYYAGITLAQHLKQSPQPPDEGWLRALLSPLLDALQLLHSAHCFHRDIAPDNILLLPDGRPLLLDFGAARRVIGDLTKALTVILKTGYAPVEQYGDVPDLHQGAWTDFYALGSVVHFAITGSTPPPAIQRFLKDKYQPLERVAAGRYGARFLKAIDRTLAVLPKDRPQTVAELRGLLGTAVEMKRAASRAMPLLDRASRWWPAAAIAGGLAASAGIALLVWRHAESPLPMALPTEPTAAGLPVTASPPAAVPSPSPPIETPVEPPPAVEAAPPAEAPATEAAPPPAVDTGTATEALQPAAPVLAKPAPRSTQHHPTQVAASPRSRRCADILQRVSLGEPMTADERDYLKDRCGSP
jgi:hypothetical protein